MFDFDFCFVSKREHRDKINVEHYQNGTISYQEPRRYDFVRERSSEDETVTVTTLNIVYMVR